MRAVRVTEFGDPEVLVLADIADPAPAAGQVLVQVERAGVAFGDVIVRSGRYPLPLPWVPGLEVGGRVVGLGPGADPALLGRTVVATTAGRAGGYAELAVAPADYTFPVPDGLDLEVALTVFQSGALARGLLTAMGLSSSDTVLVTAAAGRIGSMVVQTAKAAGARVIGVAGTAKTAAVADFGADHALDYESGQWGARVRALTGGRGVDLVLDAVGGEVAAQAISAAADGAGRIGLYGFASGDWAPVDAPTVSHRGLTVCGALGVVIRKSDAEQRADAEGALAAAVRGELKPRIHARVPLAAVATAHRELEQRLSVGAVVLSVGP
ncbi:zinc-binding dehydrogenase [Nocardia spumae]|uniref:zinc-binding dehydrogenase n=1 Tax=Nocardia spumae TaxID=2887190 RepID=UPI001D147377|nr:zinc-binding dehydrogenase [Nocardia spumae]